MSNENIPQPLALARTSAGPSVPPPAPLAVQVLDQLGDIVGVIALTVLCMYGRLSGLEAGGLILSLLGVQTGVRKIVGAKGGGGSLPPAAGVGAVTLLLLALFGGHSGTHAGFARVRTMRLVALAAVLAFAAAVVGCAGQQQGDSMTQLVNGYSTFRSIAARVCAVVTALPPPPTPTNAPLDGGVQ